VWYVRPLDGITERNHQGLVRLIWYKLAGFVLRVNLTFFENSDIIYIEKKAKSQIVR
jgi:hypothetical protein